MPITFRQITLLTLSFVLFVMYFSLNRGIVTGNPGSHYAIAKALFLTGSAEIGEQLPWADGDNSIKDGKWYSNKSPGFGYFMFAYFKIFYFAADAIPDIYIAKFSQKNSEMTDGKDGPFLKLLVLLMPLLAVSLYLILFLIMTELKFSFAISAFLPFLMFPTTIFLRYFSNPSSHGLCAIMVCASYLGLLKYRSTKVNHWLVLAGFCLGYGVTVDTMSIFLYLPYFLFCLVDLRAGLFKTVIPYFVLGSLGPALFLAYYNWHYFGSPLDFPAKYSIWFPYHKEFSTTFDFSASLVHMKDYLFGSDAYSQYFAHRGGYIQHSILNTSQMFKWAPLGFLIMMVTRKRRADAVLLGGGFFVSLFMCASYVAFDGGADSDYRYLLFSIPLLVPLVGQVLNLIQEKVIFYFGPTWISAGIFVVWFGICFQKYIFQPFITLSQDIHTLSFEPFEFAQLNIVQGVTLGSKLIVVGILLQKVPACITYLSRIMGFKLRQSPG